MEHFRAYGSICVVYLTETQIVTRIHVARWLVWFCDCKNRKFFAYLQLFRTVFSVEKVFLCFVAVVAVVAVSFTERGDGGLLSFFLAICRFSHSNMPFLSQQHAVSLTATCLFSRSDMPLLLHDLVGIDVSVLHRDAQGSRPFFYSILT